MRPLPFVVAIAAVVGCGGSSSSRGTDASSEATDAPPLLDAPQDVPPETLLLDAPNAGPDGPHEPTGACGFSTLSPTCNTCLDSRCCGESEACAHDPECAALDQCWYACSPFDQTCRYTCLQAHPEGVDSLQKAFVCMTASCGPVCPSPNACGDLTPGSSAACTSCIEGSCCDVGALCGDDPECAKMLTCLVGCSGDSVCTQGCEFGQSEALQRYEDWLGCYKTHCAATCLIVFPKT